MAKYKTVRERIPEIGELELPPDASSLLDSLCAQYREKQSKIEPLADEAKKLKEQIDPLAKVLAEQGLLPTRTLGDKWDLRQTVRQTEKVNVDRLKTWLLRLGLTLQVPCPVTQTMDDGSVQVCEYCNGSGQQTLDGLRAVLYLVEEVTDRSSSVSWSVYGRDKSKENEPQKGAQR